MAWEPITTSEQLIGAFEKSNFDLKKMYDLALAKAPYDMAKDVAAFASSSGGSVLVGLDEAGGRIAALIGVANAPAVVAELGVAVKTFCAPSPRYEERVIQADSALALRLGVPAPSTPLELLAINVPPDPRGPIGVRPKNDRGNPIEHAFGFPVRIGEQTTWLGPEQLPMWMNSHERRIAIRVRQVMVEGAVDALFLCVDAYMPTFPVPWSAAIRALDEANAVLELEAKQGAVRVPLTYVRAVWRDPGDERWRIAIDGAFFPKGTSDGSVSRFIPTRQGQ